jgi:hypothetical protein
MHGAANMCVAGTGSLPAAALLPGVQNNQQELHMECCGWLRLLPLCYGAVLQARLPRLPSACRPRAGALRRTRCHSQQPLPAGTTSVHRYSLVRLTCRKLARAAGPQVSPSHWNRYTGPEVRSCARWKSWVCSVIGMLPAAPYLAPSAAVWEPGQASTAAFALQALPQSCAATLTSTCCCPVQQLCRKGSSAPFCRLIDCMFYLMNVQALRCAVYVCKHRLDSNG